MKALLGESLEAYYWIGFLLADGWFDFNRNNIGLVGSKIDLEHLDKYANFIDSRVTRDHDYLAGFRTETTELYRIMTTSNREVFQELVQKFKLQPRKTYNPPELVSVLQNISDDFFLALFVGFVDGDGTIISIPNQSSLTLRLQNHVCWQHILRYFEKRIYDIFPYKKSQIKMNSSGCLTQIKTTKAGNKTALLSFARRDLILDIYTQAQNLRLPFLERKWNKIQDFLHARERSLLSKRKDLSTGNTQLGGSKQRWTISEEQTLKMNEHLSASELQKSFFPYRSCSSISSKRKTIITKGKA